MKKSIPLAVLLILCVFATTLSYAQSPMELRYFNKIVVSPRVNIILQKGDKESIRVFHNEIPESKVNVTVHGNKLRIYLDKARLVEKQVRVSDFGNTQKRGIYAGKSITVYVTYTELKSVEIRGEGELRCDNELKAERFKLKAYGENEIRLTSLNTNKFKASMYGNNALTIRDGHATNQVYRLFGENKIDTGGLHSEIASTRIFGEGRLSVNASSELRINAFGEPTILVQGAPMISKGIIVGKANIRLR